MAVKLPSAVQCPAVHAPQELCCVYVTPPSEKNPRGHGLAVAEPVPLGQKCPLGQGFCC